MMAALTRYFKVEGLRLKLLLDAGRNLAWRNGLRGLDSTSSHHFGDTWFWANDAMLPDHPGSTAAMFLP
jgi:hypothetical protein